MKEVITAFSNTAVAKATLFKTSKGKYLVNTMMAGFYVGVAVLLIGTIGGLLAPSGFAGTKIVVGIAFSVALSLVIMAGADLFTGNNMVMTIGRLENKTTWGDAWKVWTGSYVGNFLGCILIAYMFKFTGLASGHTAEFMFTLAGGKMSASFTELLFRGIFCNILVCLAVWCATKMKEETAKLIMIVWCLFAFVTTGFEHSIANMTLFVTTLIIPHPDTVSVAGMIHNLIPVTIGNIIGGAVFVGAAYWYAISGKQDTKVKALKKHA